jgi:hypothetical protein
LRKSQVNKLLTGRVTMHQQQSCYYQPYMKQLKCQCSNSHAASTYLHLRMEYFIRNAGQEVSPSESTDEDYWTKSVQEMM